MKRIFNKIFIAGLSAAVLATAVPAIAKIPSTDLSVSAALLDESQVSVESRKIIPLYKRFINGVNADVEVWDSSNVIRDEFEGPEFLEKFSIEIEATNTSADELKSMAYMGFDSIKGEYIAGVGSTLSECIETKENTYVLNFDICANGGSYIFQIQGLDDLENLKVNYYSIRSNYIYMVEATCPDGDGICAFLPDPDSLTKKAVENWAKNQCLLANSYKTVTDNKGYDTIYYFFNGSPGYASASSITWKNLNNGSKKKSGVIRYTEDARLEEYDLIRLNNKSFNYFTMHEMSHVYNMNTAFDELFNFRDDFVTNPRALEALRKFDVNNEYKVRKLVNSDWTHKLLSYEKVYEVNHAYKADDDYIYYFAKNLLECCGWNNLETFYSARSASEYSDLNAVIDDAERLIDELGIKVEDFESNTISGRKKDYLKFVNMMRWLYSVSAKKPYNQDEFIKFIDETFTIKKADGTIFETGLECIPKFLAKEDICDIYIVKQPKNVTSTIGSTVTVNVEAEGALDENTPELKYQWYEKNPESSAFVKSTITSSTYSAPLDASSDGRQLYCVIADRNNRTVTTNTVTIKSRVAITKQPESVSAAIGGNVKTTVTASGKGLKYQWYVKSSGSSVFAMSSITSPTYSVPMNTLSDGRQLYCVITDLYGNKTKTSTVTLGTPVTITKQPTNASATIGTNMLTSVKAEGHGLQYQCYYCNPSETTFKKSSITSATYYCQMTEEIAGCKVYCKITDMFGNKVQTKGATLMSDIKIMSNPTDASAAVGKKASTSVTATGKDLKYTWYVRNYNQKGFYVSSITDPTYSYVITDTKNGRQAYCVVTDRFGNEVTTNLVNLTAK